MNVLYIHSDYDSTSLGHSLILFDVLAMNTKFKNKHLLFSK